MPEKNCLCVLSWYFMLVKPQILLVVQPSLIVVHPACITPHVWCKNTMCVDSTSFLLMEKHLVTGTTMPSCFYISVGAKTAHKQNSDAHSREIIDLCNPGFWFPAVGTHVRLFRHTSSSKKQGEARWSLVRMCDCFFFCDLKDIPGHRMSRIPATRSADECFLQSELDTKFCPHHSKQGWICIGPYNDRAGMCRPQLP